MNAQSIGIHISTAQPGDIHLGEPLAMGDGWARAIHLGDAVNLTFSTSSAPYFPADHVATQVAALAALADAAIEAAHWLEDVAQDQQAVAS